MKRNSSKKLMVFLMCIVLALCLCACSKQGESQQSGNAPKATTEKVNEEGWKFKRRVEIMIPAAEGGGLDTTIRAFQPLLEKELGTSVVINNRGGSNGITGYTWSHSSVNDGYAFQFTAPSAILADAQGLCPFDLMAELIPVCGLTSAEGIFFSRKGAPFNTPQEMIDYCKQHPGEVTLATDSPNGISGALAQEFCSQAGIQLKLITSQSNEANISLIAGDVDLYVGTWSDMGAYVDSGDINALVVLAAKRNDLFNYVPCSGELGFDTKLSYYRVFTALKGTPQEAIDAFEKAVRRASQQPEWNKWLAGNGMANEFVYTADELRTILDVTHKAGEELAKQ